MFGKEFVLEKIRKIADYQFGKGVGEALFPDNVEVVFSRRTGRIKYVYLDGELLVALNPLTGLFTLTLKGARRVFEAMEPKRLWVRVSDEAASFVEGGSDVFAKYIIDFDPEIRPGEEVIIINNSGEVIAVGKSVLSGMEMKSFSRGVAVKVRRGRSEK